MRRESQAPEGSGRLTRASIVDAMRLGGAMVLPTLAQGVIVRRPRMLALAARLDANRRADRLLQRLRGRHGPGPLSVRLPGRRVLLLLSPDDVRRVLTGSPEPFAVANREKRGALSHFQPDGVLLSHGGVRHDRRRFNEAVLGSGQQVHELAGAFVPRIREEAGLLLSPVQASGRLAWNDFSSAWWRIVRRIVLGDAARDDQRLTDLLAVLRSDANWSWLRPKRTALRERFDSRLQAHLRRAEPGSLASLIDKAPATAQTNPAGQVPHWLFAFDAAGIATLATLALLATHPSPAVRVRQELAEHDLSSPHELASLAYLRACVLESVRLWPTTLAVLRDSTTVTAWNGERVPPGTAFVIFSSFFHRDSRALPFGDRFAPEIWLDGRAHGTWSILPFSNGSARCAGQDLVLLVTTTLLAALLRDHDVGLLPPPRLAPQRSLPCTLNHFGLRFTVTPRSG